MEWGPDIETLLCAAADQAQGSRVASPQKVTIDTKNLTHCFSLPIIVLSALSGSLQFLSKGVEKTLEQLIVTCTAFTQHSYCRNFQRIVLPQIG